MTAVLTSSIVPRDMQVRELSDKGGDYQLKYTRLHDDALDGKSEEVMGEAVRKYGWKRNDLVISTKV